MVYIYLNINNIDIFIFIVHKSILFYVFVIKNNESYIYIKCKVLLF